VSRMILARNRDKCASKSDRIGSPALIRLHYPAEVAVGVGGFGADTGGGGRPDGGLTPFDSHRYEGRP
jgi:hypothetical protein